MNKVYNIPVELNEKRQEQMAGLEALYRLNVGMRDEERDYHMFVNGELCFVDYTTRFLALSFVSICFGVKQSFDDAVKMERSMCCRSLFEKGKKAEVLSIFTAYPALVYEGEEKLLADLKREVQSECDRESGDVLTRNPSPDEPEQEAETVPNAEEAASADEETRLSVRMADGSMTMMTLDEIDKHRKAARGESEPPEANLDPDDGEDFLSVTPLPCSYPHDPTVQYTPYDPALYEDDAYESGGRVVLENPEALAFVDALSAALCR